MDEIVLTLNGSPTTVRPGATILELARDKGVEIPTLCFRPELSPTGACRLCLVEVAGSRTLVASCHTPVAPNMVIQTHSPKVLKARTLVMELLLASHSGFCWSCDKANICELRRIAAAHGVGLPPQAGGLFRSRHDRHRRRALRVLASERGRAGAAA